jgi:hypothetical protein
MMAAARLSPGAISESSSSHLPPGRGAIEARTTNEAARRRIEWIREHYRRALAIGAAGLLNAFFRSPNASSDMLGFSNAIA